MSGRKGKEDIERYVKLDDSMTNSAAWTALSVLAIWAYIELRKSFNSEKGGNDRLVLPYSEVNWRMSRGTHVSKMKELVNFGFIDLVEHGGLFRRPSVYRLSMKWKRISREIVDTAGKEAIKSGLSKKPSSKNNLRNLTGKRTWER